MLQEETVEENVEDITDKPEKTVEQFKGKKLSILGASISIFAGISKERDV